MITKDLKVCRKCFAKLWPDREAVLQRSAKPLRCEMCKRRVKLFTIIRNRARPWINL